MSKEWNKDMHDRLKDFPKKAPEGLLDDIKSEMARRGLSTTSAPSASHKLFPVIIRRVAAIAAMILLLWGLGHHWTSQTDTPTVPPTIAKIKEANHEPIIEPSIPVTEEKETSIAKAIAPKRTMADTATTSQDTLYIIKVDSIPQKEETPKVYQQNHRAYTPKKKHSSFTTGIYYSGLVAQGDPHLSSNDRILDNMAGPSSSPSRPNILSENLSNVPYPEANLKETKRHHLPIRFGLSLRYNINERWSLQSGLTYSYLASDFSKSNQRIAYKTKQKLHYVGIPLQAGVQIWTSKDFKGYISAGGQMEKLVNGKATTHYSVDNKVQSTTIETISDNRLLFSALASIGAEYALNKDFSLYAEPGIHYYFKNGNRLNTHYNEQPLNINITIGFRFHWNK